MTAYRTTTYIIAKGTVVVARKKRNKPADAIELARRKAEREAYTRRTPSEWGLNEEAQSLEQHGNVGQVSATREKTARIYRYDAFGILHSRGGLSKDGDENAARLGAVRRFEATLAQRMRLEGTHGTGPGGGGGLPYTLRSMKAAECVEHVQSHMTPMLYGLLLRLVGPSVERGQPVNNWRLVVQIHTGEHYHIAQASMVRSCAESLLSAWQAWDQRERRAA